MKSKNDDIKQDELNQNESSGQYEAEPIDSVKKSGLFQKIKEHKVIAVIIALLLVLTVFRIGTFIVKQINPAEEKETVISVQVEDAKYTSIASTAPLSGRIAPKEEVAIVPLAQGKVTAVHVKVGDYVNAGTVLFEIDKTQVSTTYNQTKEAYNLAKSTYDNMTLLYKEGAVSKSDYDAAKVSYVSASETFKAASEAYNNCNVTSPIDGYVTSLSASVGNLVGTSMAASVANIDELQIETTVSEYLASFISIGDTVDIYITTLGDKPYTGTVTAFSPVPAMGTLTYPITITVNNDSGDIMSGMFAEVKIKAEESAEAICVPSDAVIIKNGASIVVTLTGDKNNIPLYNEVTTGIDNGEYIEITKGIKEGDKVVVSGQEFVKEGVAVKIVEK